MNTRFTDLKTAVGNNVRDTSASSLTIWGRYVNEAYNEFLKRTNYISKTDTIAISAISGTQNYVLPDNFGKEEYIVDTTNGQYLTRVDSQRWAIENPSLITDSGTSYRYDIIKSPVRVQPSAGSTISVSSSNVADTSQSVFIRGLINGIETEETLTLNGTTAVLSTGTYDKITKITKSASTEGLITITDGTTTLAVLSKRSIDYVANVLVLFQTPSSNTTLSLTYFTKPLPMSNDNDAPEVDCADFLIARATAKAYRYKRQFNKASEYDNEAEIYLDNLVWEEASQPNKNISFAVVPYSRETT